MTLEEAFAAIEHLPARERLVIGSMGDEDISWLSGSIDNLDRLHGIWDAPVVGPEISNAIDDYRLGKIKSAIMVLHVADGKHMLLALGPESAKAIAKSITDLSQEMVRRHAH